MVKKIIFMMALGLMLNCKEKKPVNASQEMETTKDVNKVVEQYGPKVKAILEFAGIQDTGYAQVKRTLQFKVLDTTGNIKVIDFDEGVTLFSTFPIKGDGALLPIMEIQGSQKVCITVNGKGFAGPIWAKLLVDDTTREIVKIEFGHQAETEGYGAEMTKSYFSKKFVGKDLNLNNNTFILKKQGKETIEGASAIDGISGATVTSAAVVQMLNNGFMGYRPYFEAQK